MGFHSLIAGSFERKAVERRLANTLLVASELVVAFLVVASSLVVVVVVAKILLGVASSERELATKWKGKDRRVIMMNRGIE